MGYRFTEKDVCAENATVSLVEKGWHGNNAVKIVFGKADETLYLYLPEAAAFAGKTAHITFRLFIEGEDGKYDETTVLTGDGRRVDYGFPQNTWSLINFDSSVCEKDGRYAVCVRVEKAAGKTVYLSDAEINDDTFALTDLLGGVKLYQMENVSALMCGYVVVTPEGRVLVIDGGGINDADNLYSFLKELGGRVDGWFLTHFHEDHVNALVGILEKYDIIIEKLYYDFRGAKNPDFKGDKDNPCVDEVEYCVRTYPEKVRSTAVPVPFEEYVYGSVRIMPLNEGYFADIENPVNNSCVAYKMYTPKESVLFLGDLGSSRGDEYLQDERFLRAIGDCRIVQMAHHGQNGVSDRFYNAIEDIRVCLYPAAKWIFDSDFGQGIGTSPLLTMHTRDLMRERGVRASFSCVEGRVLIE